MGNTLDEDSLPTFIVSTLHGVLHSRAFVPRQRDLRIFYHGQHGKEFLGAA